MRIAILGDTHFAVRNGSKVFCEYFEKFYDNIFFPYLLENNIKTVVQLGDLYDTRKYINYAGLSKSKKFFFDKLKQYDIRLITLLGNHDIAYKDTLELNSPSLLLNEYDNITLISKPSTIDINGYSCCIIPWVCRDNEKDFEQEITTTASDICFGHFEISGFAMNKGIILEEGYKSCKFEKFEFVFTGHYHHRSNRDNIYYLGTPYELTWIDDSDPKGFHIFDMDTRKLDFINNPYKMFNKVYYDDVLDESEIKSQIEHFKLDHYENTYLKVVVKNKNNPYLFDLFIDSLYKVNPVELVIIEDHGDVFNEELNDVDETEDTITILNKFIDNVKTNDLDSNKIKQIMIKLYDEAINMELK